MNVYRNLIILVFSSLVITWLVYEGAGRITFKPFLSAREQELASLSFEQVKIIPKNPETALHLEAPFGRPSEQKKEFPPVPLSQLLSQTSPARKNVSLILIRHGQRMAIINNQFVKEGDFSGKGKVLKIEIGKVLIREDGTDKWFALDQERRQNRQESSGVGKSSGADGSNARIGEKGMEEGVKAEKDRAPKTE